MDNFKTIILFDDRHRPFLFGYHFMVEFHRDPLEGQRQRLQ